MSDFEILKYTQFSSSVLVFSGSAKVSSFFSESHLGVSSGLLLLVDLWGITISGAPGDSVIWGDGVCAGVCTGCDGVTCWVTAWGWLGVMGIGGKTSGGAWMCDTGGCGYW